MHTNQKCEQKHEDIVPSQTFKKKESYQNLV